MTSTDNLRALAVDAVFVDGHAPAEALEAAVLGVIDANMVPTAEERDLTRSVVAVFERCRAGASVAIVETRSPVGDDQVDPRVIEQLERVVRRGISGYRGEPTLTARRIVRALLPTLTSMHTNAREYGYAERLVEEGNTPGELADPMPTEAVERVVDATKAADRDHPIERHIAAQILEEILGLANPHREEILDRLEAAGLTTRRSDALEPEAAVLWSGWDESGITAYLAEHPSSIGALREVVSWLDNAVERVAVDLDQARTPVVCDEEAAAQYADAARARLAEASLVEIAHRLPSVLREEILERIARSGALS